MLTESARLTLYRQWLAWPTIIKHLIGLVKEIESVIKPASSNPLEPKVIIKKKNMVIDKAKQDNSGLIL